MQERCKNQMVDGRVMAQTILTTCHASGRFENKDYVPCEIFLAAVNRLHSTASRIIPRTKNKRAFLNHVYNNHQGGVWLDG